MEYLFIGLGGVFGALSRYGLGKWTAQRWQGDFPLGTFIINISGSFALGMLYVLFLRAGSGLAPLKSLTTTGFLGAYTTYSTFSYEIINLVEDGVYGTALKYFLASIIFGLAAAFLGVMLAQLL